MGREEGVEMWERYGQWIGERGWFVCCSEIVWDRCGLCDKVRLCGRGVCVKYSGN